MEQQPASSQQNQSALLPLTEEVKKGA